MLRLAGLFLVIAILVSISGLGGIARTVAESAKLLFLVFLELGLVSLALGRRSTDVGSSTEILTRSLNGRPEQSSSGTN